MAAPRPEAVPAREPAPHRTSGLLTLTNAASGPIGPFATTARAHHGFAVRRWGAAVESFWIPMSLAPFARRRPSTKPCVWSFALRGLRGEEEALSDRLHFEIVRQASARPPGVSTATIGRRLRRAADRDSPRRTRGHPASQPRICEYATLELVPTHGHDDLCPKRTQTWGMNRWIEDYCECVGCPYADLKWVGEIQ